MEKYCVEDLNHLDDTTVNLFDSKDPTIKNETFSYFKTEDLYCKIEEKDVLVSKNFHGVIENLTACKSTDGVANLKNEFIPEDCVTDEAVSVKIETTEHTLEFGTIQELEHIFRDYNENVADEGVEEMEQQEIDMKEEVISEEYECHDCNKVLTNQKSLKHHIKQCHEEVNTPTFQCYHCNKIVKHRQSLIFHLRQWHTEGDKLFHCNSCMYKTNIRKGLVDHVYKAHIPNDQKPTLKCKLCPYETKSKGNLTAHVNRVHLRKTEKISCPKCTYQTYDKYKLKVHLKYHEDNFQRCPECSQLVQEGNFYHHVRNHQKNKLKVKKKCPKCGKEVFELRKHLLTHAGGQARIQCPECSYSAVTGSTVKKHIQKYHDHHKKQESFICYHCNKEIVSKTCLIKHLRTIHTNDSCECHICGKKLKSKLYLSTHVRRAHDNVKWLECDLCPEETRYRTKLACNLKTHMVRHLKKDEVITYKCEYCPYEAKVPRNLQQHVYRCHLKKSKGLKTYSI